MKNKFSFDEFKLIFSNIFRQQKSVSNRGSILVRMIAWGRTPKQKVETIQKMKKVFNKIKKEQKPDCDCSSLSSDDK